MQTVVKNLLEPEWESVFEENSYGFRPGRSCADAIEQAFIRIAATGGGEKGDSWVLDADISGFFDNISHSHIENSIGKVPGRELIKMWLKSGFMDKGTFNETIQGTPQGGAISPLLANIGLHGLERVIKAIPYRNPPTKNHPLGQKSKNGMGIIRYADDFIVTAHSKDYILEAKKVIEKWLKDRNLELSEEKTRIVHTEDGFNFLGFNLRTYKGKALFMPSKSKVLNFCKNIGKIVKSLNGAKQEAVISTLNPILRGFSNYYRGGVSKEIFSYIDYRVWQYLWWWAKRRHPHRSKSWIKAKYFHPIGSRNWVFAVNSKDRRNNHKYIQLYGVASTKIVTPGTLSTCTNRAISRNIQNPRKRARSKA